MYPARAQMWTVRSVVISALTMRPHSWTTTYTWSLREIFVFFLSHIEAFSDEHIKPRERNLNWLVVPWVPCVFTCNYSVLVAIEQWNLYFKTVELHPANLGSIPDQGSCAVFLGKILKSHNASLHPGTFKWVLVNLILGTSLWWTSIPSREE